MRFERLSHLIFTRILVSFPIGVQHSVSKGLLLQESGAALAGVASSSEPWHPEHQ